MEFIGKIVKNYEKEHTVNILIAGRTGSGKSSFINTLMGNEICKTGCGGPITQNIEEYQYTLNEITFSFFDVPGFGEANKTNRISDIFSIIPKIDLVCVIIAAPDRAWEYEGEFISAMHSFSKYIPIVIIGNKIDMLPPVRDWCPQNINLQYPLSEKDRNIKKWSDALKSSLMNADNCITEDNFRFISCGELYDKKDEQFGIEDIKKYIKTRSEKLKDFNWQQEYKKMKNEEKSSQAQKIIWGAGVAATAAAATPIPVADMITLTSIQIGMILGIASIYGQILSGKTALSLLAPAAAAFGGRSLFMSVIKSIPGVGTVLGSAIGAGIAGPMTLAIGFAYQELFAEGTFNPSPEEISEKIKEHWNNAQKEKDQLKKEAQDNASNTLK